MNASTNVTGTAPVVMPSKSDKLNAIRAAKGRLDVKRGTIVAPTPAKAATTPSPATAEPKRGAKSIVATKSPTEIKAEVEMLLEDLKTEKDPEEKKKIRRKLRLRGHKGGLGAVKPAPVVAAK